MLALWRPISWKFSITLRSQWQDLPDRSHGQAPSRPAWSARGGRPRVVARRGGAVRSARRGGAAWWRGVVGPAPGWAPGAVAGHQSGHGIASASADRAFRFSGPQRWPTDAVRAGRVTATMGQRCRGDNIYGPPLRLP